MGRALGLSHAQPARWFRSYNARYFGGRLPPDTDVFYAPIELHAECAAHDNGEKSITIDTRVADTWYARGDLLHEMNHLDTGDFTHGRVFQNGMKRLARAGAFRNIW